VQDFENFAASQSRETFIDVWRHPFLVGEGVLHKPRAGAARTLNFEAGNTFDVDNRILAKADRGLRLVLPVRKQHDTFPSMITVGRTRNNDVVIADVLVSKFHAFFRVLDEHYELADAGSQNGTRVGERVLVPKGPAQPLQSGDIIHFAQLCFRFLDAGACWDELHAH
jgi:hypothetical protein